MKPLNLNLIDLIKAGFTDLMEPDEAVESLTEGMNPTEMKKRISDANQNDLDLNEDNTDKIRAELVAALLDPKNVAQMSDLSGADIDRISNLAILNRYFFADSPIINDSILLEIVLNISRRREGRKEIGNIVKLDGMGDKEKRKSLGMGLSV